MAMFGGEEEKMEPQAETIVGVDVTVKGNLKSPSNITINGTVKGKVDTKADVNIGDKAKIEGSVEARKITVSGTIQGNVHGSESLEIKSTGKVYGDICTANLVIQSGAVFEGKSTMTEKREQTDAVENLEQAVEEVVAEDSEEVQEEVAQ